MKTNLVLVLGLLVLLGCSSTAPRHSTTGSVDPASDRVTAYYFHGTVRCEKCIKIERLAQACIQSRFAEDLAAGRLAFRSVNYDEPNNAHFSKDYELTSPSLVLVRSQNGKEANWTTLKEVWDLVEIPPKLDDYIEEQTRKFMAEAD